jgi:Flp pilus assembly protein TadG
MTGAHAACLPAASGLRQRGAAAVEFAFAFPILFLLIYGVIVYSYVFMLQQSINYAAQQAAEAAVAVTPDAAGYDALASAQARSMASRVLQWLPQAQQTRVLGDNGDRVEVSFGSAGDSDVVQVRLRFTLPGLFPVLVLPFVGEVPRLPAQLVAQAVARV